MVSIVYEQKWCTLGGFHSEIRQWSDNGITVTLKRWADEDPRWDDFSVDLNIIPIDIEFDNELDAMNFRLTW